MVQYLISIKMKLISALSFLVLFSTSVSGQELLNQNFQSGRFPPFGWKSQDIDNNTVDPSTNLTGKWQRAQVTAGNNSAVVTSFYSPVGTSDDWLITPALEIPQVVATHKTMLSFTVVSATNSTLQDLSSYELKISTSGTDIADFTDNINVAQTDEANEWLIQSVDLSAYAGQTIHIAWRNVSTNTLALGLDNVKVETVVNNSVALTDVLAPEVIKEGENMQIRGEVTNTGADQLTSFEVEWNIGNGQLKSEVVSGVSIDPYHTEEFVLQEEVVAVNPGNHMELQLAVGMPNNQIDSVSLDDNGSAEVFVNLGNTVARSVLFEEFTTSGCGFCPDGHLVAEEMESVVDDVIIVGVHACFGSDAMTVPEATQLCNTLGSGSAPTAVIDRAFHGEESQATGNFNLALGRSIPAGEEESPWLSIPRDRSLGVALV